MGVAGRGEGGGRGAEAASPQRTSTLTGSPSSCVAHKKSTELPGCFVAASALRQSEHSPPHPSLYVRVFLSLFFILPLPQLSSQDQDMLEATVSSAWS